jgi:uncharacterized protein with PhoU and TrkA domain
MDEVETIAEISDEIIEERKSLKDILIEMKDTSEAIVDLAYSALLLNSKSLGEVVNELGEEMDKLRYEIEIKAMLAARNQDDAKDLAGILHVAHAAEKISNAALDIIDVIFRGEADHQLLISMIKEADEPIIKAKVAKKSILVNKTLKELKLATHTGVYVIAIRRNKKWYHKPGKKLKLKENDLLLATGDQDATTILNELASGKRKQIK